MSLVAGARAAGLTGVEYLDPDQTREIVPAAAGPFLGAMWSPLDAQCQPDKGTRLFVRRAERAGARFAYGVKATRLLESRGRIAGVQTTRGRVGGQHTITCEKEVIVCAGAYNSPKLLMLSGIGDADQLRRHGLDVVAHVREVGRNLQNHPGVDVQFATRHEDSLTSHLGPGRPPWASGGCSPERASARATTSSRAPSCAPATTPPSPTCSTNSCR
jgi:choline dehydrogenase-like flavoprotein